GWERGPMTMRMLEPQRRELLGVSWAWSPGTNGAVAGPVVLVDARTQQDFARRFAGKLRGAWVMTAPATPVTNPDGPKLSSADSTRLAAARRAANTFNDEERRFVAGRLDLLVREGIAGIVRDGAKEFALFTMSGSPMSISPVP